MTNLKETIDFMVDKDYKKRFVAEYWQTKIRYEKLKDFCNKIEAYETMRMYGDYKNLKLPQHDCPLHLLREQQNLMGQLLHVLELRAVIEDVDLQQPIISNDTIFVEP